MFASSELCSKPKYANGKFYQLAADAHCNQRIIASNITQD